jgi:hypothetical protein
VATADGIDVRYLDGHAEGTPGTPPEGKTLETADGKHVVVDIGNGRVAPRAGVRATGGRCRGAALSGNLW